MAGADQSSADVAFGVCLQVDEVDVKSFSRQMAGIDGVDDHGIVGGEAVVEGGAFHERDESVAVGDAAAGVLVEHRVTAWFCVEEDDDSVDWVAAGISVQVAGDADLKKTVGDVWVDEQLIQLRAFAEALERGRVVAVIGLDFLSGEKMAREVGGDVESIWGRSGGYERDAGGAQGDRDSE